MMLILINFQKFHSSKSPVPMEDIDLNKMLTSDVFPYAKKLDRIERKRISSISSATKIMNKLSSCASGSHK